MYWWKNHWIVIDRGNPWVQNGSSIPLPMKICTCDGRYGYPWQRVGVICRSNGWGFSVELTPQFIKNKYPAVFKYNKSTEKSETTVTGRGIHLLHTCYYLDTTPCLLHTAVSPPSPSSPPFTLVWFLCSFLFPLRLLSSLLSWFTVLGPSHQPSFACDWVSLGQVSLWALTTGGPWWFISGAWRCKKNWRSTDPHCEDIGHIFCQHITSPAKSCPIH